MLNNAQPAHDPAPSPTVSASRKRKTSQSIPLGAPSLALHPQPVATPMQPSSSAAKRGTAPGTKGKKLKSVCSSVHSLGNNVAMGNHAIVFSYFMSFDYFYQMFVSLTGSGIARCIFNKVLTISFDRSQWKGPSS